MQPAGSLRAAGHRQHLAVWLLLLMQLAAGAPPPFQPKLWNSSCNYTISNIPAAVFFNRTSSVEDALFPVSPGYRIPSPSGQHGSTYLAPVQRSCFGPGQRVNQTLVASGLKMPCGFAVAPNGTVDYWEEAACELSMRSNCYCYALNAQSQMGYCIPGYKSTGSISIDFSRDSGDVCADAARKVQLDGGRRVTRQEVYSATQPAKGHFIALTVWPGVDFHFQRRDADGSWSQKRGDTFVTNTYPNGSVVYEVEDPAILGSYKSFCGYFQVDPDKHASTDSSWTYSSVPKRLEQARGIGCTVSTSELPHPSTGWMRLNYPYLLFGLDAAVFEAGARRLPWQDSSATLREAGSSGRVQAEPGQHSSSAGSSSRLKPHWVSHAQQTTTIQERDRAVRAIYASAIPRKF